MAISTTDFLQRLRIFVENEADAQYEALNKQWNMPLHERISRGWAIEGLCVIGYKDQIVRLTCSANESRFREGDLVVLHRGDPRGEISLQCEIQLDNQTEIELYLKQGNEFFIHQYPEGWVMDEDWFDSSRFYLSSLDKVADTNLGRSVIMPLLMGSLKPQIDYAKYERAKSDLQSAGLNGSQIEAVALSYSTNLLHLIQGQPGTGKTLMLAHLARMLATPFRIGMVIGSRTSVGVPLCVCGTTLSCSVPTLAIHP